MLLYKSDSATYSQHSAVLLCIERQEEAMAELTDQEMNDHMDDYEEVSVSKDNEE